MEQIACHFTSSWVPATGLSAVVDIWTRDGTQVINNWALTELAWGWYLYNFNQYNSDKVYLYTFDGWATLADADRYKAGWNDLDAYSNKYSYGRTAIPTTNYIPNFQKIEKQLKGTKYPTYDDKELKKMLKWLKDTINSKTDESIVNQILQLQEQINELNAKLDTTSNSWWERLKEEMEILNANLDTLKGGIDTLKDNIWQGIRDSEAMTGNFIRKHSSDIEKKLEEKLDPWYLWTHIGKPVDELSKKVENMFVSMAEKNIPKYILDQFDIKFSKKDDTEALQKLEEMFDLDDKALKELEWMFNP